ncbi:MAG: OmpH family outer membrane protein [Gemmatimonadetes bacterium]|nr:OmpH family outer membrane protein [Gemmatimonadota bacterium]
MSFSRFGMAVALSLLFTASLDAQATRIGYIHVQEVMAQYPPAQAAIARLEGADAGWTNELQTLVGRRDQLIAEYQQQQMNLTPEARQAREQEITTQNRVISTREGEIQNEARQLQDEVLQPVMDEITAVIEEVRVEGGYALILDANSNAILAADESLNLTQEVLNRLEEKGAVGEGR